MTNYQWVKSLSMEDLVDFMLETVPALAHQYDDSYTGLLGWLMKTHNSYTSNIGGI